MERVKEEMQKEKRMEKGIKRGMERRMERDMERAEQKEIKKETKNEAKKETQKEIQKKIQKERTISYYNENAEAFCAGTRTADMSEMRGRFLRYVQPDGLILDAGCGSGRDSKYFLEHGYRVVAMDASEEICRLASEYLGQAVECRRFEEIAEKEIYDGIWACASLLHVPYVELPETIAKLGEALVDGGVLYASFKYGGEEKIRRGEKKQSEQVEGVFGKEESEEKEEREAGGRYFTDLTEEEWKKVLAEAEKYMRGFRIEMVECFVTGDVREGRGEEKWLNVVGRKMIVSNYPPKFKK